MLELRPTCEHCNKSLPPDSLEAMICSYECTFCKTCVDQVIDNVCPNFAGETLEIQENHDSRYVLVFSC